MKTRLPLGSSYILFLVEGKCLEEMKALPLNGSKEYQIIKNYFNLEFPYDVPPSSLL